MADSVTIAVRREDQPVRAQTSPRKGDIGTGGRDRHIVSKRTDFADAVDALDHTRIAQPRSSIAMVRDKSGGKGRQHRFE